MEFMGFHTVDIVIAALVLFLAIKGLINGFSKELLNFITIVGGIALAANFNTTVVNLINEQHVVPNISDSYAKIVGFIIIIVAVWLIISVISSIISRFGSETISPISRIFGYIISAARYFVIFALIVFGMNQSEFFKNEAKKLKTETKLFVPMTKIGATILNIDLNTTKSKENNSSTVTLNSHETTENESTTNNDNSNNKTKEESKKNKLNKPSAHVVDSNKDKTDTEQNSTTAIVDENSSTSNEQNLTD